MEAVLVGSGRYQAFPKSVKAPFTASERPVDCPERNSLTAEPIVIQERQEAVSKIPDRSRPAEEGDHPMAHGPFPEGSPVTHAFPRSLLLVLGLALLVGCTTRYIGNTQVEDTEENRAILRVIEQYRRAVEDRDIQRILDLTSDNFFEDPGTPGDPSDDYDKRGLRLKLEESFAKVEDQNLRIDVLKLDHLEENRASVDYRFAFRYRLMLPSAEGWREHVDVNRVVLVREGDGQWRFLSGL